MIDRIKDGDTDAFRELVDGYKDVSLSLACSILKDEQKAEDALQDAFIKVFEKLYTFRYEATFSTWLYRIVVNTCYNELRRYKSCTVLSRASLEDPDGNHALGTFKVEEQKKFIQLALKRLRTDESLVLRLFYLCNLKIKDIEGITGFTGSKIKVDLHRGRNNLNHELTKILGKEINDLL